MTESEAKSISQVDLPLHKRRQGAGIEGLEETHLERPD